MKLNSLSASISEVELEAIIKKAVQEETGLSVNQITFDIGMRALGYGMNESDVPYFKGATVVFDKDQPVMKK